MVSDEWNAPHHCRIGAGARNKKAIRIVATTDKLRRRRGGSKGRITTLDQGIIGRCARTGKTEYVNFSDEREYQGEWWRNLVSQWEQAESRTTIARSYIAVPLFEIHELSASWYFFSTEPQVFPHAARESNLAESAQDLVAILRTASIV